MKYSKKLQVLYDKLTWRQKKFVDLWDGNQENSARLATYKDANRAGVRCMQNDSICQLIRWGRDQEIKPDVMSRQERQKFWSDVLSGKIKEKSVDKNGNVVEYPQKMQDRLKASDLLGKSEGDFLLRHEHTGEGGGPLFILSGIPEPKKNNDTKTD